MIDSPFLSQLLGGFGAEAWPRIARPAPHRQLSSEAAAEEAAEEARVRRALIVDIWDTQPAAFETEGSQQQIMRYYAHRL